MCMTLNISESIIKEVERSIKRAAVPNRLKMLCRMRSAPKIKDFMALKGTLIR